MYCSQCGCENVEAAAYCKSCGKPISRRVTTDVTSSYPRQVNVNASRMPAPSYAAPAEAVGRGHVGTGINVKLIGVIVAVIAAVIIAAVVAGGFGAGGDRLTSDQLAQDLTASYSRLITSGFSDSATTAVCNDILDMMPPEAVDAALEKAGITDRSDVSGLLSDYLSSSLYSSYASYLEKLDVAFTFFVGDEISSSTLDSINSDLQDAGIDLHVSSGNKLGVNVKATALEDVQGISAGESVSQDIDSTGLIAINIDGKWYLWGESML